MWLLFQRGIYSYALSLVMPNSVSDMSVEDELKELNRRAEEMETDPSVCIPHEEVYDRVMARLHRKGFDIPHLY